MCILAEITSVKLPTNNVRIFFFGCSDDWIIVPSNIPHGSNCRYSSNSSLACLTHLATIHDFKGHFHSFLPQLSSTIYSSSMDAKLNMLQVSIKGN